MSAYTHVGPPERATNAFKVPEAFTTTGVTDTPDSPVTFTCTMYVPAGTEVFKATATGM